MGNNNSNTGATSSKVNNLSNNSRAGDYTAGFLSCMSPNKKKRPKEESVKSGKEHSLSRSWIYRDKYFGRIFFRHLWLQIAPSFEKEAVLAEYAPTLSLEYFWCT